MDPQVDAAYADHHDDQREQAHQRDAATRVALIAPYAPRQQAENGHRGHGMPREEAEPGHVDQPQHIGARALDGELHRLVQQHDQAQVQHVEPARALDRREGRGNAEHHEQRHRRGQRREAFHDGREPRLAKLLAEQPPCRRIELHALLIEHVLQQHHQHDGAHRCHHQRAVLLHVARKASRGLAGTRRNPQPGQLLRPAAVAGIANGKHDKGQGGRSLPAPWISLSEA